MSTPELSILIVCWRSREHIVPCLDSVYEHTRRTDFEVVLINNADDDLESFVARKYPRVRIVGNHENLGFAGGNNRAAQEARGQYLLLLNPDTWLRDAAIDQLMDLAKRRPDGGAWGGVTELPDGRLDPGCNQYQPRLWNTFLETVHLSSLCERGPSRDHEFEAQVPVLNGAYLMIHADVWRQIDGFDPSFVMYSDEADLCTRIRAAGYRVYMTGKSRIVHNVAGGDPQNPGRLIARARGKMTFFRKHHGPITTCTAGTLMWIRLFCRWCVLALRRSPEVGGARLLWRFPNRWWGGWTKNNAAPPRLDRGTSLTSVETR